MLEQYNFSQAEINSARATVLYNNTWMVLGNQHAGYDDVVAWCRAHQGRYDTERQAWIVSVEHFEALQSDYPEFYYQKNRK